MGPNLKAAIWMALAMALLATPGFVLSFFPLKPLWLHGVMGIVVSAPGIYAIIAASKNYHKPR